VHHDSAPTAATGGQAVKFLLPAMVVVAALLGAQTVQLISLQRTLKPTAAAAATVAPATSGSAPPLPSSLQNLPNMVGGC